MVVGGWAILSTGFDFVTRHSIFVSMTDGGNASVLFAVGFHYNIFSELIVPQIWSMLKWFHVKCISPRLQVQLSWQAHFLQKLSSACDVTHDTNEHVCRLPTNLFSRRPYRRATLDWRGNRVTLLSRRILLWDNQQHTCLWFSISTPRDPIHNLSCHGQHKPWPEIIHTAQLLPIKCLLRAIHSRG